MYNEQLLIGTLVAINIFTFLIMVSDKRKSILGDGTERIPEGLIFFMAVACGSLGVYVGMLLLRHKTRKWYFQIGIPLLIFQNLATLYIIRQILS
ncbi:DUF1294 domain-containing protein [Candidatus Parcubacteria bacterium]|nr:DUF1294 domain-containing protein [Candidatus Parcubacteria bacterium]